MITWICIILLVIIIPTCRDNGVNPLPATGKGQVLLSLAHAPAQIVQVVARLTRQGYDDRVLVLSIADTGQTASGTLTDVPVGTWHLKVDAIDGQGHVQFSGETDVEVRGGQTTQATLQLNPTTGNLEIVVTWGAPCLPPPTGLVSWWRAEDNTKDAMGTNDATLINSATFSQGKVGSAFQFDGSSSYVRIPHSPSLNTSGSFTLEGWIYPTKDTIAMIVCKWGWTNGWENQREYSLNVWTGRSLEFGICDDAHQQDGVFQDFQTPQGVVTLNSWNHVAAVYDKSLGQRRVYVNGVQVAQKTDGSLNITQSTADVSVGAYLYSPSQVTNFFSGKIDELSFYDRSLSSTEIKSIYDASNTGKCVSSCIPAPSGLVSWWRGNGNADDAVGGSDGSLMNGATFAPGKVGQAFSFDGVDDYVRIPNSASLNPTGSFTIDAWIYPTNAVLEAIVYKWGDQNQWYGQRAYAIEMRADRSIGFAISDSAHQNDVSFHDFQSTSSVIELNQWNHLAASYDKNTGKRTIYVNGAKVGERTDQPITVYPSIADLSIGSKLLSPSISGYPFQGRIDEVDIFNRALSESEIKGIFDAGSLGKCR